MNKRVELPLMEPMYSTYHNQGPGTAILVDNPTIRNWYLNQVMILICGRDFLKGSTTPGITIAESPWRANPYLDKICISTQFAKGYINPIIREMLDNGYYVSFGGVDDYYLRGKSWYKQRHFSHDGLICGYDQGDKTYCIYAYDSNWVYQKFWTPQKDFNAGRIAMLKQGVFANICAIKGKSDVVNFCPKTVYTKIKEYLNSNLEKFPFEGEGIVYGIVVHEYIAEYVLKLQKEEIPYERMDRRVFRLIWEHKKAMLERISLTEEILDMDNESSGKYNRLVNQANTLRLLYASHHMKRRDSILPIIRERLLLLMSDERQILEEFVRKMEAKIEIRSN